MEKEARLIAYLQQFRLEERNLQLEKVLDNRTKHFTLALEDIFQPHNSNAVIRSCDCFGIQDCHVIEQYNKFSTSVGVSKGAIKWVNIIKHASTTEAIQHLRAEGYQIVATGPHTNDFDLEEFDVSKKSVFFFGAEKKGLSEEVMREADAFLKIPMMGHTESLNISVSAAIILQTMSQRIRKEGVAWQLSETERTEILLHWMQKSTKNMHFHLKNFELLEQKP
jgi:tRNA (guanosine-2'-O-)-methyltransferase